MKAIRIPAAIEQPLTRAFGADLEDAALEALAIEGYRTAKLTAGEVAKIVGLETSIEGQRWLARHGVSLNYSLGDLEADRVSLAKQFPEMSTRCSSSPMPARGVLELGSVRKLLDLPSF